MVDAQNLFRQRDFPNMVRDEVKPERGSTTHGVSGERGASRETPTLGVQQLVSARDEWGHEKEIVVWCKDVGCYTKGIRLLLPQYNYRYIKNHEF